MQIKRKPAAWVLFATYLAWDLVLKPIWTLNVERAAQESKIDTALTSGAHVMSYLHWLANYIPSSFGLGFVTGGLIFAYWDSILVSFQRHVLRRSREDSASKDDRSLKAWAGEISASFSEKSPSEARIFIRVINWGSVPFKIQRLTGHIELKHANGLATLLTPSMGNLQDWGDYVDPGFLLHMDIVQPLPREVTDLLPDMFIWSPRTYFEFENLDIILVTEFGEEKRLKLPDSLRLTAGDWVVRSDQTTKMWKSEEERIAFQAKMRDAAAALAALGGGH